MKKMLFLFVILTLSSCSGESIYSKTDKNFDENRWQKSDVKTYAFDLDQNATPYELEVFFSHVYDYQFPKVPLILEITHPDGQLESIPFDLNLKDDSGKDSGDCSGDFCDLTQTIEVKKPLTIGKYKVRLMHNFSGEFLPNVLAVGIRVNQLVD